MIRAAGGDRSAAVYGSDLTSTTYRKVHASQMIAIATVLAALLISLLITRIATIALGVTGLSRESARFQARSAFTGVGFTTSEAESVVNHPIRRAAVVPERRRG